MLTNLRIPVILLALLLMSQSAQGQSNQFRDARAHLGVAIGVFTYHGPIDLLRPRSSTNFVREHDPGVALLGSFPILADRLYFRAMVGFSNFDTSDGRELVRSQNGLNQFLTEHVLWFEPEVVYTLTPGSRSRLLPYVFTGFGGMLADPFGRTGRIDIPGSETPGPERSVFTIPVGAGIDFAVTRLFSFFVEGSWRFDLNYVLRNEPDYHRHNTSFVYGGIRIGIPGRRRRRVLVDRPGPIPPPQAIPAYAPPRPLPIPVETPQVCSLVELNSVYFNAGSSVLDAEARRQLDENIDALRLELQCCVDILGYTDETTSGALALRLSQQRAQAVFEYYVGNGLDADRFQVAGEGVGVPPCGKDEEGPGCRRNNRVDSIPLQCVPR